MHRITRLLLLVALPWLTLAEPLMSQTTQPSSLPATILPAGTTQRELRSYLTSLVKPFKLPATANDWEKSSETLRSRALKDVIFRGVPEEWRAEPTRVEWRSELAGKGYRIRKLRYEVVPGLWVGGLLYQPDELKGKVPAILNVNGHEPTGMFTDYVQARSINLAKRGMLVLALEWIGVGQLNKPGYHHNEQGYLDLCGVAGVSVMYLELKRGLDVLLEQPNADAERVAVTGMSGGGWQTILISSLDTRVKLSAPNAGYSGVISRIQNPMNLGDYEQCPPDLAAVADYTYLTAMLAPRAALLIYNEKDNCCYRADLCKPSIYDPIVPAYELFGHPERFTFHINSDPGTHNYLKDNRQAFYRAVHTHLAPDATWSDDDIPVEQEVRTQEELTILYGLNNADFHSLAKGLMRALPAVSANTEDAARRAELRRTLRMDSSPAAHSTTAGPTSRPAGIDARQDTFSLKLGDRWTVPALALVPPNASGGVDIVLADDGRETLQLKSLEPSLREGRRVVIVDLLLMGECKRVDAAPYLWSLMLNTLGRRSLGMQIEQLASVTAWVRSQFESPNPPRLIARGLNASVVALTLAALDPRQFERLELWGIEPSFKKFIDAGVTFGSAPPIFCPGLLRTADIPDLVRLAEPTQVVFKKATTQEK